jgi:DNA repair protein RecO (recombination protein O)
MEWRDQGIILGCRSHGETSAIAEIFTREHGRCLGLIRGGRSRRLRPILQPGNIVDLVWRARLEEHLGTLQLEPVELRAGFIMEDRLRLSGLTTIAGLAQVLPEREPHPRLYDAARLMLDAMEDDHIWPALLVRWEMGLLDELGFGLDLDTCAATGIRENLTFVSPRSGKAVCEAAGRPYVSKLFHLPAFLRGGVSPDVADIISAFRITGHFLDRHIFSPRAIAMPGERQWLTETLAAASHQERLCSAV